MRATTNLCLLFGMIVLAGCGSSTRPTTATAVNTEPSSDDLKSRLEIFAQTGMVGSGAAGMKVAIQELAAEKSGPLLKHYDELMQSSRNPAKVKEIAKKMIDSL